MVAPPALVRNLDGSTTMYSCYTAATFGRELDIAQYHGINLDGALTWAFEFEIERPAKVRLRR